jgi:hypothetical protein
MQKYDVGSAGVGALTVTSYCVWKGQDPITALSITLAATVVALVSSLIPLENFTPMLCLDSTKQVAFSNLTAVYWRVSPLNSC